MNREIDRINIHQRNVGSAQFNYALCFKMLNYYLVKEFYPILLLQTLI